MLTRLLAGLMGAAARRPLVVAATVLLLAAAGAGLALRLETRADIDTLVGRSTPGYAATQSLHERFGDDAVYVVVREPVANVVLTAGPRAGPRARGLPVGQRPAGPPPGAAAPDGPCARLARTKPAKVVFGPGTFLNEAVGQISDQFAAASGRQARQAEQAARAAYKLARARGSSVAEAAVVRREGQGPRHRAVLPRRPRARRALRHHLAAEPQRPAVHRAPGVRRPARAPACRRRGSRRSSRARRGR